jgi:hypothetical protein
MRGWWRDHFCLVAVIFGAAVARVALFCFAPHVETPDTAAYIESGTTLFATGRMSSSVYMPLYPILLHVSGYYGVIWVQIALSAATAFLVYDIARAIWHDERAGLIAAALYAVHPLLIYFAIARLTETLAIFLLTLGLRELYRQRVFTASVALVLLDLTRPSVDFVLPLLIIVGAFACDVRPRALIRRTAIFFATYVALMAPWWVHNYRLYGQFVRLDLADGTTLILENSESFERHGLDWSVDPPWQPFATISDPVARNDAMKRAALNYIRDKPMVWLAASFDRLRRFFLPWPDTLTEHSTRLAPALAIRVTCAAVTVPVFLCAFLAPLIFPERRRAMMLTIIPIVYLTVLHAATHALWRYRMPLDPLLVTLAAGPFALAWGHVARFISSRWASTFAAKGARSPPLRST